MDVFEAMTERVATTWEAWKPNELGPESVSPLSKAVQHVVGVKRDTGFVSYIEWKEIHTDLAEIYRALNEASETVTRRPTDALAWANAPERTLQEVLDLVGSATAVCADPPQVRVATPRPSVVHVDKWTRTLSGPWAKKWSGSLLGAFGTLHAATPESSYSDVVLRSFAEDDLSVMSDLSLLSRIDSSVAEFGDPTAVPVNRALGHQVRDLWAEAKNATGGNADLFPFGKLLAHLVRDSKSGWWDDVPA